MASKAPTLAWPWTTGNCRFEIGTVSLGLADGLLASDIAVGATPGGDAVLFRQSSGAYLTVLQSISQVNVVVEDIAVAV